MTCSPRLLARIDRDLASRDERTRWQAAIALGEFVESQPEKIWPVIVRHGSRRHADTRMAIATCVLEQYHFDAFFPLVAEVARSSHWFGNTFRLCWAMGEAELPKNIKRWRKLERELEDRPITRPRAATLRLGMTAAQR